MKKRSNIYWICQLLGWSFYLFINLIFFGLKYQSGYKYYVILFFSLPLGIGITHVYREAILKYHVLRFKIPSQLIFIIFFSVLKALIFFTSITIVSIWLGFVDLKLDVLSISELVINYSVPFFFWNIIYFGFKYFQNYKRSEINSLRLYAASRESELNNLKSQLNPHFMFNSLNSIRALIDEDAGKAKVAVTKLSNILRTTLLINKSKLIPLRDEINLVMEYLDMEKIRYEERINFEFKIDENVMDKSIPPFIIQAQVENAVKHGIAKLPGNGSIVIQAFLLGEVLKLKISNTGRMGTEMPLTGVGIKNSIQRLELMYGSSGKLFISQVNNWVVVDINIPLK
ncbi:MAG: histidine kinase [Bacteroidetes bacterium]|nr:histidine kinase [Bacteroidota bacterium]